jgi:hypothetical protein
MKPYPGYRKSREEVLLKGRPIVYDYTIDPDELRSEPEPGLRIKVHISGAADVYRVPA